MLMNTLAKSSRSSRIAFSAAIVIIVAVAAYNWMVAPHTRYLHAARRYEHMMGDMARKNKIIKTNETTKRKEVEKLRAELASVQSAVFTAYEARRFFTDIEAICNAAGCLVYSINSLSGNLGVSGVAASAESDSGVVENSAVVSFVGSYSNIISFLSKVTNRPQKVAVRSLKIASFGKKPDPLECEMVVTIYTIRDREIFANE
jgi:Tfp pilus assembly protein PilO